MSGRNKCRRKKCRWNKCHLGINVVQSSRQGLGKSGYVKMSTLLYNPYSLKLSPPRCLVGKYLLLHPRSFDFTQVSKPMYSCCTAVSFSMILKWLPFALSFRTKSFLYKIVNMMLLFYTLFMRYLFTIWLVMPQKISKHVSIFLAYI